MFPVPADSGCLFHAINHQLQSTGRNSMTVFELRSLASEHIRTQFLPYILNPDANDYLDDNVCIRRILR